LRYDVHFLEKKVQSLGFTQEGERPLHEFWQLFQRGWQAIVSPIRDNHYFGQVVVLALIAWLLSAMFFLGNFMVRGWRLAVVSKLADPESGGTLPRIRKNAGRFISKGIALAFYRFLYFLPQLIIVGIVSPGIFELAWDLIMWLIQNLNGEPTSLLQFFVRKIPDFIFALIFYLVVQLLYFLIVWPIYRINMIKYSLRLINSSGFVNRKEIKDSIRIYRAYAPEVLGVCFFYLLANMLSVLIIGAISVVTLGLSLLVLPVVNVFVRHWPIAFAYGWLGRQIYPSLQLVSRQRRVPKSFA